MLGTRSAGELAGRTLILEAWISLELIRITALRARRKAGTAAWSTRTAGTTLSAAIKDRTAALDAGVRTSRRSSGRRRWRRSLVDGARPGLRHDDLARLDDGSRRRNGDRFRRGSFRNGLGDNWRRRGSYRLRAIARRMAGCNGNRSFRNGSGRRFGDGDCRWRSCDFGRFNDGSNLDFRFSGNGLCGLRNNGSRRGRDGRRNNRGWSCGHGRLNHHGSRRRNGDCRTSSRRSRLRTGRWTRNDRPGRRTRGDGRSRCRRRDMDNRRSLARLRHDPARLRPGSRSNETRRNRRCRRRGTSNSGTASRGGLAGTCSGSRWAHHDRGRRRCRTLRVLRRALCFLLARQNRLHHIAGLGDIREVDLGAIVLLGTRTRGWRRPGPAFKIVTHAHGLMLLNGTRVGLAVRQIHMFQCVENLFTLDFQLTRQIVNSNLTQSASFRCPALCRLTGHSNLAAR